MSRSANWPLRVTWTVVGIMIAVTFAVALWYGLAYFGMTMIIFLDYIAYPLSWMRVGPAVAWLIVGCIVGAVVGLVRALRSFGRKSEARKVILVASVLSIFVWTISLGATSLIEKKARQKAEAQRLAQEEEMRRKARDAEETAMLDKAWAEGRLWQIASITNQTNRKIPFQILNAKGNWDEYWVKPGASVTVSEKTRELTIRFDSSYAKGYQAKRYNLPSTPIIGHEPNKSDQAGAQSNTFRGNGNGFDLYH
jgi:hypothetical protein